MTYSYTNNTIYAWDLADVTSTGGTLFPDTSNGVSNPSGMTFTIANSALLTPITVTDNDSEFNDGDSSQDTVAQATLEGDTFALGDIAPEYSYIVRPEGSTSSADNITVYAFNMGNDVIGFVTTAPMQPGQTYDVISLSSNCPSVSYSSLATTALDPLLDGIVEGTSGNDVIDYNYSGDPEGDRVDHNDALLPGEAPQDDIVLAGAGNDTVNAGAGDDDVYGGDGNDVLNGEGGDDLIVGGTGDDSITGGTGNDTIFGDGSSHDDEHHDEHDEHDEHDDEHDDEHGDALGGGNDTISGGDGNDVIYAGAGNDAVDGGADDDLIVGGAGDDTITGGTGNDEIWGDSGDGDGGCSSHFPTWPQDISNVVLYFDTDGDGEIDYSVKVDGFPDSSNGSWIDNDLDAYYAQLRDFVIDNDSHLSASDTVIGVSIKGGIEPTQFFLVEGDENCTAPDLGPTDNTGPNADATLLFGSFAQVYDPDLPGTPDSVPGGDDLLSGGDGSDTIHGEGGDDTIIGGTGADSMSGDDDRDTFYIDAPGDGAGDVIDGGEGGDDFDTLDLRGSGPLRVTIDDQVDPTTVNGHVDFLDADGNITGTLTFTNIEDVIPCFTPGTLIATPRGERLVEELKAGDRVLTRDNGIQEIRWAGRRALSHAELNGAAHLKPVLIRAGSLGNGLPERDMLVSPNHRMLVANEKTALYFEEHEVLVSAKHLVDNKGVRTVETLGTTYLHFMFDRHEVILANGAWTESFQPGDYTLGGMGNAQRGEIFELFPELKTRQGLDGYSAARKTLKRHEAALLGR